MPTNRGDSILMSQGFCVAALMKKRAEPLQISINFILVVHEVRKPRISFYSMVVPRQPTCQLSPAPVSPPWSKATTTSLPWPLHQCLPCECWATQFRITTRGQVGWWGILIRLSSWPPIRPAELWYLEVDPRNLHFFSLSRWIFWALLFAEHSSGAFSWFILKISGKGIVFLSPCVTWGRDSDETLISGEHQGLLSPQKPASG